jgi:lipoate-protein ligase A
MEELIRNNIESTKNYRKNMKKKVRNKQENAQEHGDRPTREEALATLVKTNSNPTQDELVQERRKQRFSIKYKDMGSIKDWNLESDIRTFGDQVRQDEEAQDEKHFEQ